MAKSLGMLIKESKRDFLIVRYYTKHILKGGKI
jgi:hypothetical protein